MPTVDVYNTDHDKVGTLELNEGIFAAEVKEHLFHTVVRYQLAKRRAGTHAAKGRAQVTGRARAGTTRAPHWRGGGVVHGPHPRSHAHSLTKKVRSAALRSALSRRTEEDCLTVFDAFSFLEARTRNFVGVMKRFAFSDLLLVLDEKDELVCRSARNIPGVTVLPVAGLNVYDVLKHQNLAMTRSAVERVVERLGG